MTPEKIELYQFLGTYLVRTGAILLIVFGLKILISFYKYNIRMADFSESIANSLGLVGTDDISKLKDLAEIMNTTKIDFEKNPGFLPEDLLGLVKGVNDLKK